MAAASGGLLAHAGESVVYTPAGGVPRTILAIVTREPVAAIEGAGGVRRYRYTLKVRRHATAGILPTETGLVGGTIALTSYPGGPTVTMPIGNKSVDAQKQLAAFVVIDL
jgi:hypothetical protein